MRETRIAAVGPKDSVLAFKALGVTVMASETPEQATRAIHELAQKQYAVIFLAEDIADRIPETLSRYKTEPLPAIIPIPGSAGSLGIGMRGVRANVEKAIGADILFQEEG